MGNQLLSFTMKTTLFLIFAFATLVVYATKHDDLKCYTCGNTQEGPEELGWCKNQDDQGNVTTCFETEQSCAVGQIDVGGDVGKRYIKKCWPGEYHATGCIDIVDGGITGRVCLCGEDSCNVNFDALNGGSTIVVPIITVVVNMAALFMMN